MKSMKEKVKKKISEIGERTALRSVGKSDPKWVYEVEMPEVLKTKLKNDTNQE